MATAKDIMQRDVICVSPETGIQWVAGLFQEGGISEAPVIDDHGRLLGIISTTNLVHYLAHPAEKKIMAGIGGTDPLCQWEEMPDEKEIHGVHIEHHSHRMSVRDIMTASVWCINEECPLVEIMDLMARTEVRLLVVVRHRTVVGVVTALDVIGFLVNQLLGGGNGQSERSMKKTNLRTLEEKSNERENETVDRL